MIKPIAFSALIVADSASVAAVDNASLPEPVRVPAGNSIKLESMGTGALTYE